MAEHRLESEPMKPIHFPGVATEELSEMKTALTFI